MSFIVPIIQHGRQGLCYLNLSGMVANDLYKLFQAMKIHFNNFIDNCSFLMFQFSQNNKMRKLIGLFSFQRFNKDIKIRPD